MAALNKVMIIGNIGKDPEIRMTPSGQKVATFSIATTERYTDKSGVKQEKTEWHNIVAWRKLAEIIERYVKKGSSIYVEGKLSTRTWDDPQSGQKRYKTEIVASQMQMLGGRVPNDNVSQDNGSYDYNQASGDIPDDNLPF